MNDPEFLADAQKVLMEIDPLNGDEMASMLSSAYAAPKLIIEGATALVQPVQ